MNEGLTDSVDSTAPFGRLLGIEWREVTARLAWDESRSTAGGILHGGALTGVADSAGGLLSFLNLPEGATGTAKIESKTNFFARVRGGQVHATARPLHKGKRTIVVDTDLRDDRRLVAPVTQTQAVLV